MGKQIFFITGTDTGVGKTVTTAVLGLYLRQQGFSVGVLKPVQCAGDDAAWLKKVLDLPQALRVINPIYAPEPLSPHLALKRAGKKFDLIKIKQSIKALEVDCDIILCEGAGGLLVPLKDNYTNADLAHDLKATLIIVSRLGLGTINHTLLTLLAAKDKGLKVEGVVFSDVKGGKKSIAEKTNPYEIKRLTKVKVLGIIPHVTL